MSRQRSSPVAAINRAIAVAETRGAAAGLAALPNPEAGSRLAEYQPYWAARAELLSRLGEIGGAQEAYDQAIGLEDVLSRYERGHFLLQFCQQTLAAAEKQIELITKSPDGALKTAPLPEQP